MFQQVMNGFIPADLFVDEPDVSLTDFGLALETTLFAVVIARRPGRWPHLQRWCVAFFGSAAVAALAGGIDHGFFRRDGRAPGHDVLWATSLLAIGGSALALVGIAVELGLDRAKAKRLVTAAAGATGAYALLVLAGRRDFQVAILAYTPAALLLATMLARRYNRQRDHASLLGTGAVALTFAAAAVQQLEIGATGVGHNALYHLIQALAFGLLFAAARTFITTPAHTGTEGVSCATNPGRLPLGLPRSACHATPSPWRSSAGCSSCG